MSNGETAPIAPSSSEEGVGGGGAGHGLAHEARNAGGSATPETLAARARTMRNNPTEPEKRLWMALRGSHFADFKFRRQDVIGSRIVDFFCPARGLVIEVDGDTHHIEADKERDARMLREFGFVTVRFANADVMGNLEGCLMQLQVELADMPERWAGRIKRLPPHHPPTPSSEEEGEK